MSSEQIALMSPRKRLGALKMLILRGVSVVNIMSEIKNSGSRKIILLGTPLHFNLGDHLLALSEMDYLKAHFGNNNVIEVPTCLYLLLKERLEQLITQDDIVFISGGGWMGDRWKRDELTMRDMVASMSQRCRVVVLPQTVYYAETNSEFFFEGKGFWGNSKQCTLCLREEQSLSVCLSDLGMAEGSVELLPDAGLLYRPSHNIVQSQRRGVGVCLRSDIEATLNPERQGLIKKIIANAGYYAADITTLADKGFSLQSRRSVVENRLSEFANKELIITDRLHGMIFAYLTRTPCLAFDNVTGKVRGVYGKWLNGNKSVIFVESPSKLTADMLWETSNNVAAQNTIEQDQAGWLGLYDQVMRRL